MNKKNVKDSFIGASSMLDRNKSEKHKEYDFRIIKINSKGPHRFYKLQVGDESNTNNFQTIKLRVLAYLFL